MPMSRVSARGGDYAVFPHIVDRYKPGVIAVLEDGTRFVNESNSYLDIRQSTPSRTPEHRFGIGWSAYFHLTAIID